MKQEHIEIVEALDACDTLSESAIEQFRGINKSISIPGWRPAEEWNDEMSSVLWTRFPVVEPYYVGSPLCTSWTEGYYTHFMSLSVFDFLLNEDGNLKQQKP